MKKFTKVLLIIAAVSLLSGIILSVTGLAMGAKENSGEIVDILKEHNVNIDGLNTIKDTVIEKDDSEQQLVYTAQDIKEMEIDLKYEDLIIKEGDQDSIEVYMNSLNDRMRKVYEEAGKLIIDGGSRIASGSVTVCYPKGSRFDKINLDIDAGEVSIKGDLQADEVKISVGAGTMENQGSLQADKLELEVGAGEINIQNLTTDKVEAECGLGELAIQIADSKEDYDYKLECGMGSIVIDGEEIASFSGTKNIKNDGSKKNMELECGMGEINVEFR